MALVLTRRIGETVWVGDDIKITIIGVNGSQVRLAFDAPADVIIDREEIAERKRLEREAPR